MAPRILILLFITATFTTGCIRHSQVPDILVHANNIMEEYPDSALVMLKSIPDSALASQSDRAFHALLLSQAMDKNYIVTTSDSLINIAVDYFQDHNDKEHLASAYYYKGRIHSDMGDAPLALEFFQQALDVLKKHPDKDLENRIHAQRADIFNRGGMYKKAMEENRIALALCLEIKDTAGIIETAHSLGFDYYSMDLVDSAMYYYRMALDLAKSLDNEDYSNSILRRMAIINIDRNEPEQAEELYRLSLPEKSSTPDKSSTHAIGAQIAIARHDSANLKRHLDWLVDSGNIYGKKFAYRNLLEHFSHHFSADSISVMACKLFAIEDSIQANNDIHEIANFEYFYNYTSKSNENQRLKMDKERLIFNVMIAVLMIVLLLGVIYVIWNRLTIKINRQKRVFENLRAEHARVRTQIRQNKHQSMYKRVNLLSIQEIKEVINSALHKGVKKNLDWEKLEETMKKFDGDFCDKIGGNYVLSDIEWQVTMLTRIGIPPQQIGLLTHMSPSGITSIRKRLYKKVFGHEPKSPKDWDAVIHSL